MSFICPFCQTQLQERDVPAYRGLFRLYQCPSCLADVKQPYTIRTTTERPEPECPECAFGDVNCTDCGDPICPSHVRTVDRCIHYFSPDLGKEMLAAYGNRIYCPRCFQASVRRFSETQSQSSEPRRFSIPQVAVMLIFFTTLLLGLKHCNNPESNRETPREAPSHSGP